MCATLLPSSGKEKAMMAAINFANACMSASAQPDCAAFACPATTNIAIILDVSLLLASILICLLVKNYFIYRIMAYPPEHFPSPMREMTER